MMGYFREYCMTVVPVDLFDTTILAAATAMMTRKDFDHAWRNRRFYPLPFLVKLAVYRFFVDIGFWAGHRALHHPKLYWIHRWHHEHYRPTLLTNFHFHPLDLFIEAAFPVALALGALEVLQLTPTRFELNLLVGYGAWQEVGSHCAKPVPTVTYFPPLAPLYRLLLGDVDANMVKHHDLHHNLLNCNYGITIWPDMLMGTRVSDAASRRGSCSPTAGSSSPMSPGKHTRRLSQFMGTYFFGESPRSAWKKPEQVEFQSPSERVADRYV